MYGLGIAQPLRVAKILQIYRIYKDAIDLTSRWSVLDKLFFQNLKFKECLCRSHTLLIIFVGFTALQTSG